jgi:hypothetical protein
MKNENVMVASLIGQWEIAKDSTPPLHFCADAFTVTRDMVNGCTGIITFKSKQVRARAKCFQINGLCITNNQILWTRLCFTMNISLPIIYSITEALKNILQSLKNTVYRCIDLCELTKDTCFSWFLI